MIELEADVVVIGGGIAGAMIARELCDTHDVLILEAGIDTPSDPARLEGFVELYQKALMKGVNAAYPVNAFSDSPRLADITAIRRTPDGAPVPDTSGYLVQRGPLGFQSTWLRQKGGTTLHWEGTCLRMLPNDFHMKSLYGQGMDWPLTYSELEPYYGRAEWAIGVCANKKEEAYLGIEFAPGYQYPMHGLPQSYLDQKLSEGIGDGFEVKLGRPKKRYPVTISRTPEGRNGMPREGYEPKPSPANPYAGQRCEGYSACTPICPSQAKYTALKTLAECAQRGVRTVTQAVATRVRLDGRGRRVDGIEFIAYSDDGGTARQERGVVRARAYVLAASAVENAKLLLMSNVANQSDQVGRNLMDHPFVLSWGLMPEAIGAFRGPTSTSGIESLRDGAFRSQHSAFRVEIGNWGWFFANAPFQTTADAVYGDGRFGRDLRRTLGAHVSRQMRLGFLVEQPPVPTNRVTLDPRYLDALGVPRPVIDYDLVEYTRAGVKATRKVARKVFERVGIEDFTKYLPTDEGYFTFAGKGYSFIGSGHVVGTHRMGASPEDSVVDRYQRSWAHENLFVVGCGSMPTIGTSNPTLTMTALTLLSAEKLRADLEGGAA